MINRLRVEAAPIRAAFLISCVFVVVMMMPAGLRGTFSFADALQVSKWGDSMPTEGNRQRELAARFEQGVAMLRLGEFEHAVTAFHRVLVLAPRLPEAHLNMGFALYELNDYQGAQRFFEGAKALAPGFLNVEYGLAVSLFAQGKVVDAVHHMATYLGGLKRGDPFRKIAEEKMKLMESALLAQQTGRLAHD
jgi:tetratricopeptide (TPR) repeat protein